MKTATHHTFPSGEKVIKIIFPFNPKDLERVRTLDGRKYHNKVSKFWTAYPTADNIALLKDWGFKTCPECDKIKAPAPTIPVDQISTDLQFNPKIPLYAYQKQGINFVHRLNGRAIIGDDMGLGKTAQALIYLEMNPALRPVIIVVPASLKINWLREIHKWTSITDVQILSGKTPFKTTSQVLIINYDILPSWLPELIRRAPKALIGDEVHFIKNNKAQRTKAVKKLSKYIDHIIFLSGTPIENRPIEIFNAADILKPSLFKNYWSFAHRYCAPKHNGYGWDFSGASNIPELHEKLQSIMIRRLKSEVLKELPDKNHVFVPIELTNDKEYRLAESDFTKWLKVNKSPEAAEKASNAAALAEIEVLKQIASRGKMKYVKQWIDNFLQSGEKLVVFATHKFVINELMELFYDEAVKIDGSVANEDRQKAVDRFQTDPTIRLFVGNIQAAGVGLTLTAASNVAFIELPWTPGAVSQSSDRVHRIGQENKVFIYYLLAQNTIEERIASLLDAKRKVIEGVLDGTETNSESLLFTLMNDYL